MQAEASFAWLEYGFKEMKIEVMDAAAHTDNIASNTILKNGMKMTDQYLEDGIPWNWYQLKIKLKNDNNKNSWRTRTL
jgi:RimJ/RimL family protein N-acetyltransferase